MLVLVPAVDPWISDLPIKPFSSAIFSDFLFHAFRCSADQRAQHISHSHTFHAPSTLSLSYTHTYHSVLYLSVLSILLSYSSYSLAFSSLDQIHCDRPMVWVCLPPASLPRRASYLSTYLAVRPSICLCLCLSVCMVICLFSCLFVWYVLVVWKQQRRRCCHLLTNFWRTIDVRTHRLHYDLSCRFFFSKPGFKSFAWGNTYAHIHTYRNQKLLLVFSRLFFNFFFALFLLSFFFKFSSTFSHLFYFLFTVFFLVFKLSLFSR